MILLYDCIVFYDADCLNCFLAVGEYALLKQLFDKAIVPLIVKEEILQEGTPIEIKENLKQFIKLDFVEVREMPVGSPEFNLYDKIKKKYKFMGEGEASVVALAHQTGGIVASNNLWDVRGYVEDYDLKLITTAFILAKAYESGIKSRKELDNIWKDMQKKGRKRSLPNIKSFTRYYETKYLDDCLFMKLD